MITFEIHAMLPYEAGMKASARAYQWHFREDKWIDMAAYRGDYTGMSVDSRAEAEGNLDAAIVDARRLVDVHIVEVQYEEEEED